MESTILQNAITFMICVAFGQYIGYGLEKKECPEAKFNWRVLIMGEGAVIAASILSWFSFC